MIKYYNNKSYCVERIKEMYLALYNTGLHNDIKVCSPLRTVYRANCIYPSYLKSAGSLKACAKT